MKYRANHLIDLSGLMAPVAVLQADQKFREMQKREILEIKNCNPETGNMFFKLLPKKSYELLSAEKMCHSSHVFRVLLRKIESI